MRSKSARNNYSVISVLGVPIFKVSKKQVLDVVEQTIDRQEKLQIATVNPEFLVEAQKDRKLFEILQTTFNVADGVGILWAGYFLERAKSLRGVLGAFWRLFWWLYSLSLVPLANRMFKVLPERIAGADLFWDLLALAEENGWKVFLLGGSEGVAKMTTEKIKIRFPRLNIVGAISGGKIENYKDPRLVQEVISAKPHMVFVAFGCPKQEKWISYNLSSFPSPVVAMGVGGTFDFVAGKTKRAPAVLRTLGLEWLWRLILEPKKRLKRIFRAVVVFPWLILKQKRPS